MKTTRLSKTALAKKLGIARSTLYYRPKKPIEDEETRKRIEAVMKDNRAYSHRRIALALGMNHKKVGRVMRKFELKPAIKRRKQPSKPDDMNRAETGVGNIAKILCPIKTNVLWAGDFTYLWCDGQFWYVATVMDVYSREIAGWHIGNHHTTALIMEAFKDAVKRTGYAPIWFHSDQGSEYVSGKYRLLLAGYETEASHSKKSSPWQNGYQESFYANFKLELGEVARFRDAGELIEAIHRQIWYYNTKRIHTALKMPPMIFRQQKTTAYAVF